MVGGDGDVVGGQVGDAAAPVVTGLLLAVLSWQQILEIYAAVPIFLAFLVIIGLYFIFPSVSNSIEK